MKVFQKSLKISIAAIFAITFADRIGLIYSATAGIITILSIQNTKRETLMTALKRAEALLCAFALAAVCFRLMGYNIAAFAVYLFLFSMLCFRAGWTEALVMASVLVTHFLAEKNMGISLIINEILIFTIGISFGIIVNLNLRKKTRRFEELSDEVDNQIKGILHRMSEWLPQKDREEYKSSCFDRLDAALEEARICAINNYNNSLFSNDMREIDYIKMREKQSVILREIYENIKGLEYLPKQAMQVAELIKKIETDYHRENTVENLINETEVLLKHMEICPLPKTREEFEARAVLFYILKQIRNVLQLKYCYVYADCEICCNLK